MTVELTASPEPVLVIKVGGALLQSVSGMAGLMDAVAQLIAKKQRVILVHGGGCLVDEQLAVNGMHSEKLDGLRVTPAAHIPIIVGALAGTANKVLQGAGIQAGLSCVGMSLADGDTVRASIKNSRLGCVGEVTPKDASYLEFILSQGWLPIVSSIAVDASGQLLNVNADQAAAVLTQLVGGQLVLLSDVSGVLDGDGQLIARLNQSEFQRLSDIGVIDKGMRVKVAAALEVAESMAQIVRVGSWKSAHQLLGLNDGGAMGTEILPSGYN